MSRPGIAVMLPTFYGPVVVCDVGANIAPQPRHLQQYAIMAGAYASAVVGIDNPRVGLLSIGEEDAKGTQTVKDARKLMRDEPQLNFVGNVEGRDLFKGVVDVVVCDGFVGNIVLKFTEGLAEGLFQTIAAELQEEGPEMLEQFKPVLKKTAHPPRLAGVRRGAAAGRGRLLPDLPRPLRGPGDQERHPRRQTTGRQRRKPEDRREDRRQHSGRRRVKEILASCWILD